MAFTSMVLDDLDPLSVAVVFDSLQRNVSPWIAFRERGTNVVYRGLRFVPLWHIRKHVADSPLEYAPHPRDSRRSFKVSL